MDEPSLCEHAFCLFGGLGSTKHNLLLTYEFS